MSDENGVKKYSSNESVWSITLKSTLNLFSHVFIGIVVLMCLWYSCETNKFGVIELHIVLCVLGYHFFMCEGILVITKFNSWSMNIKRRYRKIIHWFLATIGTILVIVGSSLVINSKRVNFNTVHGILGFCALIMTMLSLLHGLMTPAFNLTYGKWIHGVTGIGTLYLATASLHYGYENRSFSRWIGDGDFIIVLKIFTWLFTLLIGLEFWVNMCQRIRFLTNIKMRREPEEPSAFKVIMNVINTITHLVLGAVAISAIAFAILFTPGSYHLLAHIYLCVIGYVLMMAQAILAFSPHNGWSVSLRYQEKKVIHWVMQVIGAILAITGSIIRIVNVNNNFQTPHGILGLIALTLTFVSLIGGAANLYTKKSVFTKVSHSCAGSLTLMAAFLCLCLGFDRPVFRNNMGDALANLSIALTGVGLIGTLSSASVTSWRRLFKR